MDKVEVRAIIKYFCHQDMSAKGIHDDFELRGPSFEENVCVWGVGGGGGRGVERERERERERVHRGKGRLY